MTEERGPRALGGLSIEDQTTRESNLANCLSHLKGADRHVAVVEMGYVTAHVREPSKRSAHARIVVVDLLRRLGRHVQDLKDRPIVLC